MQYGLGISDDDLTGNIDIGDLKVGISLFFQLICHARAGLTSQHAQADYAIDGTMSIRLGEGCVK